MTNYNPLAAAVIRADNAAEKWRERLNLDERPSPVLREPPSTVEIVAVSYGLTIGIIGGVILLARLAAYVAGN